MPPITDPAARLRAFEAMLQTAQAQQEQTAAKLAALKADGKEKTATYRQLFAAKLQLGQLLALYQAHGLV